MFLYTLFCRCDEKTKKLLSLSFVSKTERGAIYEQELIARVRRHKFDTDSLEVKSKKTHICKRHTIIQFITKISKFMICGKISALDGQLTKTY